MSNNSQIDNQNEPNQPTSAWPLLLGVFGVPLALILGVAIVKWLFGI